MQAGLWLGVTGAGADHCMVARPGLAGVHDIHGHLRNDRVTS